MNKYSKKKGIKPTTYTHHCISDCSKDIKYNAFKKPLRPIQWFRLNIIKNKLKHKNINHI